LPEVTVLPGQIPVDADSLAISQYLNRQFPGGLRLVGTASSAAPTVRPGDLLWVTLWWQATEPLSPDLGLILALAAPNDQLQQLFDRPRQLLADFPTANWPVGQPYRANYQLLIPADVPGGDYVLAMRLFDMDTLQPRGEQVLFSLSIEARPHIFEAASLADEVDADFGDRIRLRSFELGEFAPDQKLRLRLQWQALREMSDSYKLFVHLTDAADQIISQVDTYPQQGVALTTSWLAGEIIEDELVLTVPGDTRPGVYRLVVGWYDEKTGERLKSGPGDSVVLFSGAKLP